MFSCWLIVLPTYIDWREFEAYWVLLGKRLLNILLGRCRYIWQSIVKMDHKEWKRSVCVYWIYDAQHREDQWQTVNIVMKLQVQ